MKNLKVTVKLFWPHIVILLLLVTGNIVSLLHLMNIRNQMEVLYNSSFVVKNAADTLNGTLESMQASIFRASLTDFQDISEVISDTEHDLEILQTQVSLIKENSLENKTVISELEQNLSELEPIQKHVLTLASQNKHTEAVEYMESSAIPVIKETQKELEKLIQATEAKEIETVASMRQTRRKTIVLLISFGAASILFSIGTALILSGSKRKKAARV